MTKRRRVRSAAAVLALLTASLTACTTTDTGDPSPLESTSDIAGLSCAESPLDGCHEIVVGGRIYRYYLSADGDGSSMKALLVDIGGPGISLTGVLPHDYAVGFRRDLGSLAQNRSLLLIEEPWVGGAGDPVCRESSAAFYAWERDNWRSPRAESPSIACPWGQAQYGWNPSTYRAVVEAIRSAWDIQELDMAALSFGAVRYSYIDDLVHSAVLVRPAAAPGTSNEAVLRARTEAVWRSIAAECAGCTSTDVAGHVDRLLRHYSGVSIPLVHRSVPVIEFDIASALVAAALDGVSTPRLGWDPTAATVEEASAAELSDALWLRVGEEGVSPALVAYIDEYCQAYVGGVDDGPFDAVRYLLSAPTQCGGVSAPPIRPARPVACVVVGLNDTAAPPALAETWRLDPGGLRIVSSAPQHWFADVEQCSAG